MHKELTHALCASGTDEHPDYTHRFLMHMLNMRISFPIFEIFILHTLSRCVRNFCMHSACVSRTDAYAEHMRHKLVRALNAHMKLKKFLQNILSIRIRN
jgi:hypothetical protein